jgi:site-specific recombinase XerD
MKKPEKQTLDPEFEHVDTIEYVNKLESYIEYLEKSNKQNVSEQRELLAFKDWFNNLPNESDDRLFITDETISRFKANLV